MAFVPKHNQVGFLKKPKGSAGFEQIVDFLKGTHIRYALEHNPTIYVLVIKQFWQTVTVITLDNGEQELKATIDTHEYTISESSVRNKLKLADENGITEFANAEIFEGMANLAPLLANMIAGHDENQGEPQEEPVKSQPPPNASAQKQKSALQPYEASKKLYQRLLLRGQKLLIRIKRYKGKWVGRVQEKNVDIHSTMALKKLYVLKERKTPMMLEETHKHLKATKETNVSRKNAICRSHKIAKLEEKKKTVQQVHLDAPLLKVGRRIERLSLRQNAKLEKRNPQSIEEKEKEPVKKMGKRRKQIARKGLHTAKDEAEKDEASKEDDSSLGTNVIINPVPVAVKSPSITSYKIIKQGTKGVYQIVRENGTDKVYMSLGAMLKEISREDLIELYRIVMKRFGTEGPTDDYKRVFWENLKTLFDAPLSTDLVWSLPGQQKILS
ncbi:hypothetical protein Tco_0287669 [Tanacetum coccineum]